MQSYTPGPNPSADRIATSAPADEAAVPLQQYEVVTLDDWVIHYRCKYPVLGPLVVESSEL